jgi:hypothetical protein
MDTIFRACVGLLQQLARVTGLSYQAVNVLIFVFAVPGLILGLLARIDYLERRLAEHGEARRLIGPFFTIGGGLLAALIALLLFQ